MRLQVLFAMLFLWATSANAISLQSVFENSKRHSLTIKVSQAEIDRARSRAVQTLGGILPTIDFESRVMVLDGVALPAGTTSAFFDRVQPTLAVTGTLPIFQGFKEYAAIDMSKADRSLQKYNFKNAERLLYWDVARAYYAALKSELDLQRTDSLIRILSERQSVLNERVKLGQSRQAESTSQGVEIALLKSERARYIAERDAAYEMLSFLTGQFPHPRVDVSEVWKKPLFKSKSTLESQALMRADVKALEETLRYARGDIKVARSDLLPSVEASGNVYPYREGFQKDVRWDVTVSAKVPLFNLTGVGNVQEKKLVYKQHEWRLQNAKRQIKAEVAAKFATLNGRLSEWGLQNQTVKLALQNYYENKTDYALGLVNNLDVLLAQKNLVEAMRRRDESHVNLRLVQEELNVLAGVYP